VYVNPTIGFYILVVGDSDIATTEVVYLENSLLGIIVVVLN